MSKRAHKIGHRRVYFCKVEKQNGTKIKSIRMKTKVMIIEDSYTNRVLFTALLEELDIEVIACSNAIRALRMIETTVPDIILLDICMPIMTGSEFLQELRQSYPTLPGIVISALDESTHIEQAYALGANEYLIKPVASEMLIRRLSSYVECELTY